MTEPTIRAARYAKNMMAVHCPSDGGGFKTRAMRLAFGGMLAPVV